MKKTVAMLLTAVMTMTMFTGCGKEAAAVSVIGGVENNTAESQAEERTKLTVGFDAEFPPYGYKDDSGEYTGFDLELAQEVCNRRGWELVKQPIDWDSKDMELSAGSIDCIWNGFTMNGREKEYTWSMPYIDNSQVFVVAADSAIGSKAELAGKTVGVQKESSALAALQDEENKENLDLAASFADLIEYADYNTAFMDLEAGAIDAVAMDIGVANYQMNAKEGFLMLEEQLSSEQYAIGFLKGNTELKDMVEETLWEMAEDGAFLKIAEKYTDYGVTDCICIGK